MRTVIMSALLAAAPLCFLAGQSAPPTQQPAQKQDNKKPPATPESISPMIPTGAPADPGAPTDPSRLGGAAVTPAPSIPKTSAAVDPNSYVIGSDDEISINVFENQAFNTPVETVRPDGKVTMPLLGDLMASGKTPEQLKDEITNILSTNYMNLPPHVSVIVVKVGSKNYYITGEVGKPGKYPLTVPTTVMQALVNAGGFRDFANKKHIRIQRGADTLKFNYVEVSKGKNLKQNILLRPDDQIFVN